MNPFHLPDDEQFDRFLTQLIIRKFVQKDQDKLSLPALNSFTSFATLQCEAHVNTQIEISILTCSEQ